MLFNSANLSYWILLGIGILLFLLVIVSGGGDDDFDIDADADADVDIETDGDFGTGQILGWLGLGKAPLVLLLAIDLSAWGITGWFLNVIIGSIIGYIPLQFFGLGGIILIASFSFSVFFGSLIARPLGKIFASFGEDTSSDRLIGCVGTVVSKKIPYLTEGKIGQVDVRDSAGNLVSLSVSLPSWAKKIPQRGEKVLIIEKGDNAYLAIAKDSSDEDKWMNQ
ncbi:MAG: DUF1449 family protein [Xenococcaceae cyanobacterium MO_188.B29]|nr:DUF1449 family protein [Xenococcaceae cyanobacterium MO_188.B29]